jgi:cobalt-zinc-cadmium efflux system protein
MGAGHAHRAPDGGNEKRLWLALLLTTFFLVAEVIGGLVTGSLALISDAAHMFTDSAALAIALAAVRIGKRPADTSRTYGYYRFEILAAALNAILLFLVAIYILYEAYQRFRTPASIDSTTMLGIAAIGLVVNLVSMRILSAGKDDSMNVKGAYLEVWSDMLGSAGVIGGALLIRWTGWTWVDSAVAVAIGLWVLPRTGELLKDSLNILLEGVPEGVGISEIDEALRSVPGVASIHDLHVWAISSGKVSLTVHVVRSAAWSDVDGLLQTIQAMLAARYDIHHITVQIEDRPCHLASESHLFSPAVGSTSHDAHVH